MSDKMDRWLTLPQYLLPQHLLSKGMYHLTRTPLGAPMPWLIKAFIKQYGIDMQQYAEPNPTAYPTFNQFFTRALAEGARPIEKGVVSPVDGAISQIGSILGDKIFQAKGHNFDLNTLFGGKTALAKPFEQGLFTTIYLSPKDYHRIHMPIDGTATDMIYVPGRLFSVNPRTTRAVPGLFARNERLVCVFDTVLGPMAMVLVGAIFVGSMETIWQGEVTPNQKKQVEHWQMPDSTEIVSKGEEMGRFNMGSTVIMLFGKEMMQWLPQWQAGSNVRLGEQLAK